MAILLAPKPPEPNSPETAVRGKRGPKTAAGRARSAMNALKHGLRAQGFSLLPVEDAAAFAGFTADIHAVYAAEDAVERALVDGIAVAMWKEMRADRLEAELLADSPCRQPAGDRDGGERGPDLAGDPDGRAGLATILRYQAGAGGALRRGIDLFHKHRAARRSGRLAPLADSDCTNEFLPPPSAVPEPAGPEPALPTAPPGRRLVACPSAAAGLPPAVAEPEPTPAPVEADPVREARRLALLATVKPVLRPLVERAPLPLVEHYCAATDPDPTVYEAWFAAQPKPVWGEVELSLEDQAAIAHVTRHNPPWLKGDYLGYYRPPVPKEAFALDADGVPTTRSEPEEPATEAPAPEPAPDLAARLARLLDRRQPRLPEELDLAEAVCALRWPNWPPYHGPIDPLLLRRALASVTIDPDTLHWLGSPALALACGPEP